MPYFCRETVEWIEETIEKPIEEWVEQQQEKCEEQECNWWLLCLNKIVCWIVVVVVKVVTWVAVTVTKAITKIVCEIISYPIVVISSEFQPALCFLGISFSRSDLVNINDALEFAIVSKAAYRATENDFRETFKDIVAGLNNPGNIEEFTNRLTDTTSENFVPLSHFQSPSSYSWGGIPVDTHFYSYREANRLVIGFRGSAGNTAWIDNAIAVPWPFFPVAFGVVHTGWYSAYNSVRGILAKEILTSIMDGGDKGEKIDQICFTGHSLGGALATLAAMDFRYMLSNEIEIKNYTYGSPKVGNMFFTYEYNGLIPNSFRFTNYLDPVPELPATGGPTKYRHVKNLVHFDPQGIMSIEPCPPPAYDWGHEIAKYLPPPLDVFVAYGDAFYTIGLSGILALLGGDISDFANYFPGHNMNTYIGNIDAQITMPG